MPIFDPNQYGDPFNAYGDVPAPPTPTFPTAPTPTPAPFPSPFNFSSSSGAPPAPNPDEGPGLPPRPHEPTNTTPQACPPGKVWRADTNKCEAPDERSKAGKETCTGPQPQCGQGQAAWCNFDTAQWECAQSQFSQEDLCRKQNKQRQAMGKAPKTCAELGFGGGGRGGGKGKGGGAGGASGDFASLLEGYLRDALKSPSRYTPEALQALYGQVTRQTASAKAQGATAVRAEAARRNMSRAGQVGANITSVNNAAEAQQGAANVSIMQSKITADYQDHAAALDRAQKYLDSLRDNEYRYSLLGEQRRQFDANLALAYANLQSQWDMLSATLGQQLLLHGA